MAGRFTGRFKLVTYFCWAWGTLLVLSVICMLPIYGNEQGNIGYAREFLMDDDELPLVCANATTRAKKSYINSCPGSYTQPFCEIVESSHAGVGGYCKVKCYGIC